MKTMGARVVAGLNAGAPTLTLDVGRQDGISLDAAVLSPEGLIGRVIKLSGSSSLVQPISHASSGVGVMVERTRFQAVLVGAGVERSVLKYVPKLEDVQIGDVLLSSGADGIYPPGIPVGVVESVSEDAGFFKRVQVRLMVEVRRVSEVLVTRGGTA